MASGSARRLGRRGWPRRPGHGLGVTASVRDTAARARARAGALATSGASASARPRPRATPRRRSARGRRRPRLDVVVERDIERARGRIDLDLRGDLVLGRGSATASATASVPSALASRSCDRSASGQMSGCDVLVDVPVARATPAPPPRAAIPGSSSPAIGAHVRHRPSDTFQHSPHVYWRHVRQKLKVLWNASSWWAVVASSSSPRASAIASEKEASSDMTKFFTPRENVRTRPTRDRCGALDSKV